MTAKKKTAPRRQASSAPGIVPAQGALIARMSQALPALRRSERDVAELILKDPAQALQWSIAEAAQRAGVSQPTVARFATAMGFSGFREFKMHLAQSIATGVRFVHSDVEADDTPQRVLPKVFDRAIGALIDVRNHLDPQAMARAVALLAKARRIECFGVGNSAIVANDAQHKLLRFGIPCAASADPHSMSMVATVLGAGDVVLAISASGRTVDMVDCARAAVAGGATVIAITNGTSPLARVATLSLHVDVLEDTDIYTPMTSRLAHLVVIDALCVGIALALGPGCIDRLERVKHSLRSRRLGLPVSGAAARKPNKQKRRDS